MSDDDYETTNVHVAKPKKERTPAQKAATARALEALAAAREAKKAEKETAAAAPRASKPRSAAPRPERNVLTYEDEEPAPLPRSRPAASRPHIPEPKDYGEDIRSLSEGLHSVISYIEQKETKKKAKPKPRKLPSPSSSEEELEPEPEPEPRKKHKMTKGAPPTPDYRLNHSNPQDVLRNIFWRNM